MNNVKLVGRVFNGTTIVGYIVDKQKVGKDKAFELGMQPGNTYSNKKLSGEYTGNFFVDLHTMKSMVDNKKVNGVEVYKNFKGVDCIRFEDKACKMSDVKRVEFKSLSYVK